MLAVLSVATTGGTGQSPVERYRAAQKVFDAHSNGGFEHDDSAVALKAMKEMSAASEAAVLEVMAKNPTAGERDLTEVLCRLNASEECGDENHVSEVVELGPRLFVAQDRTGETGMVFIVGVVDGHPTVLWWIAEAGEQSMDTRGVLNAWKPENSGNACIEKEKKSERFSRCGPLYAAVGALPADADDRRRFYVDAGYAQEAGATILHQTSVWRWDGSKATLLWIDTHGFMIDQNVGTTFADGVLSIGEKDSFRTFYGCGSCEERQMVRKLRISPKGVEDMGKTSLTPELDLVDELFWRLANGRPTEDIASREVARHFRQAVEDSRRESKKIDRGWFSTGMLGETAVTMMGDSERLCFTDDELGRLYFTIAVLPAGKLRLTHVDEAAGQFGACAGLDR